MKPIAVLSCIAVFATLPMAGCNRAETGAPASASSLPPALARAAPADGRAIEVTAGDAMKFNLVEIHAKPGEALAVTLRSTGTLSKMSMGHNWVLLTADVDINAFAGDAGMAATTDYVPAAYTDRVLASTKLLGPGESDTALFYAPSKPGRYVFLCSFPGHFQVGMKGRLIVE